MYLLVNKAYPPPMGGLRMVLAFTFKTMFSYEIIYAKQYPKSGMK